jgi:hypothetical protein
VSLSASGQYQTAVEYAGQIYVSSAIVAPAGATGATGATGDTLYVSGGTGSPGTTAGNYNINGNFLYMWNGSAWITFTGV